jgi:anti-sigma-K factor RskA
VNTQDIFNSGLLESYALGVATAEEAEKVQQLISHYPEVKQELNQIELALEQYAHANGAPAGKHVKDRLLRKMSIAGYNGLSKSFVAHISTEKESKETVAKNMGKRFMMSWPAAAASIALLLAVIGYSWKLSNKNKQLAIELENKKTELAIVNENFKADEVDMKILRSKYTVPLKLKADGVVSKDCEAKIYWQTNTGEIYIDQSNLPVVVKGKQYQLWAIVDDKTLDAGLIDLKRSKTTHFQKMKTFEHADAFAITLENEGGVKQSKEKPFVIIGNLKDVFDENHHQHCKYHKD